MYTLQQMGTFIRERRLQLGLTQTEVQERSGGRVSQATLAKFESHTIATEPNLRIMSGIADALELDLNQLTGWDASTSAGQWLNLKADSLAIARMVDKLSADHRIIVYNFATRLASIEQDQERYNLQLLSEIITTLERRQNKNLLKQVLSIIDPNNTIGEAKALPVDSNSTTAQLERVH